LKREERTVQKNETTRRSHVRRTGALLVLAGLLTATGCAVGTDDDEADGIEIDSGDASDDNATTTRPDESDGDAEEVEQEEDEAPEGALLLVMDASGSMNELDAAGRPLIDSAKEALRGVVNGLPDGLHTGLRVFGHRYPNTDRDNGCRDTELISPVEPLDREALLAAIDGYDAKGFTPIGYSLQEAANDLPPEGPRTIVLVSDGDDTCAPPDPCQIATDLRADGVEVVINTVGFALGDNDTARDQLTCIAEATEGEFIDVADAGDLADTLEDISDRETRRFETAGAELEGAPIPRDADTGDIGAQHVDQVVHGEVNFYRFEIEPGSEIEAEVYTAGNPNSDELLCMGAYLTDRGDSSYASSQLGGANSSETQIDTIDPVVVDDDEVWLKLDASNCSGAGGNPDVTLDVEFTVSETG
jgi:Mg-chelatase subunit ChlD